MDTPKFQIDDAKEITTPGVRILKSGNDPERIFKRGKSYLRYIHPSEEELESQNFYDLDRCAVGVIIAH